MKCKLKNEKQEVNLDLINFHKLRGFERIQVDVIDIIDKVRWHSQHINVLEIAGLIATPVKVKLY